MWPSRPAQAIITKYSVTRKNTECCGLTGSKCLNVVFSTTYYYTFRNSTFCVSISQKPNQLLKRSKVRCKEEEERIQIIYKTQNRDLPPSGPFSQILSHIGYVPDPSSPTDDVSILKMEGRKRSGLRDYSDRADRELLQTTPCDVQECTVGR